MPIGQGQGQSGQVKASRRKRGRAELERTPPACAAALPPDALRLVLQQLDHDSLFHALQACRTWRAVEGEASLWQAACAVRGWGRRQQAAQRRQQQEQHNRAAAAAPHAPAAQQDRSQAQQRQQQQPQAQVQQGQALQGGVPAVPQLEWAEGAGGGLQPVLASPLQQAQQQAQQQQQGQSLPHQEAHSPGLAAAGQHQLEEAAPSWRERYRRLYTAACYECFQPCARTTPRCAPLVLRLCAACAASHDSPAPHHRLVAEAHARRLYCLKPEGEEGLVVGVGVAAVEG